MKSSSSTSMVEGTSITRQEYNDRVLEVNSLRTELEKCKKDKNLTAGLVTQMQRDMSNKVLLHSYSVIYIKVYNIFFRPF